MKKLTLLATLLATFQANAHDQKDPVIARVSECSSYRIIVYAKVNNTLNSTLLQYCSRNEFQEKLNYL